MGWGYNYSPESKRAGRLEHHKSPNKEPFPSNILPAKDAPGHPVRNSLNKSRSAPPWGERRIDNGGIKGEEGKLKRCRQGEKALGVQMGDRGSCQHPDDDNHTLLAETTSPICTLMQCDGDDALAQVAGRSIH